MKSFFETYAGSAKLAQLVREIDWRHNPIISDLSMGAAASQSTEEALRDGKGWVCWSAGAGKG